MTSVDHDAAPMSGAVAVYGAGSFGQGLATTLRSFDIEVPIILDRSPSSIGDGTPVLSPASDQVDRSLPVALGLCNPGADPAQVVQELLDLGHPRVFSPVEVFRDLGARGLQRSHYWLTTDVDVYRSSAPAIDAARALLSDTRSREVFDRVLAYRTGGDVTVLPEPDPLPEQYLPRDVPFVSGAVRLIDCGAFDGDTVRAYLDAGVDLAAVAALEPDPASFERLVTELARHPGLESLALPLGISDATQQLSFSADGTSGAAFDTDGPVTIQCVSLDALLRGWRPTHVKMDIEGAEGDALRGMARIISEDRPALAVSVYHRPEDIWSLLHQVHQLMSPSAMHLRVYGHQGFDTVLYAMP